MFSNSLITYSRERVWILILAVSQITLGIFSAVMPLQYLPLVFSPLLLIAIYYRPLIGYLILVFFLPNYGIDLFKIGGQADVSLLEPAVFIAFIGFVFFITKERKLNLSITEVEFAMFLLFLWAAFSIIWTPVPIRGIQQTIKILIGFFIYFLSITLIKDRQNFNAVAGAWIVMGLVISILGVYETFTTGFQSAASYSFTSGYDKIHKDVRTTAMFEGADMVGFLTSLVIVLNLTYLVFLPRGKWKNLLLIILPLALFTLITAMSRKSFVALFGALIFMQFMLKKKFLKKLFPVLLISFLGGIAAILYAGTYGFWEALSERVMSLFMPVEESIKYRLMAWAVGVDMFTNSPLIGRGLGSFYRESLLAGSQLNFPHNFYIFILSELGLVGLFFLLFWWFQLGSSFVRLFRNCTNDETRTIAVGLIAGLITIALHMAFRSFSLTDPTFWGYIGLTSAFLKINSRRTG
ncbi:MAG: O-antigen ligase domain-containing protein [Nitrospiraceae bacterium]|nr:MAG: O-antigen ligase domain-containing protein [Nitrospiraceae bacterium]